MINMVTFALGVIFGLSGGICLVAFATAAKRGDELGRRTALAE